MLETLREQNLKWPTILAELIDNSFDAAASRIQISFGANKTVTVGDDGSGCDNIEAMLTIGQHYRQPSTKLGRYGVGLKDAACWMWGTMKIDTVHGAARQVFAISWADLVARNTWDLPDPVQKPIDGNVGTKLVFNQIRQSFPGDYQRLMNELRYTFTPGLLKGKQIAFQFQRKKPTVLQPYEWPQLNDVVETEIEVDGHTARVRVGIIKEGQKNEHPGFAYCHHHRVIMNTSLGSGGLSTSHICGQVWLDDSWKLTKNKDDINLLQQELGEAVFAVAKPVLEKAQKESICLRSKVFNERLSAKIRAALSSATGEEPNSKESRNQTREASGTVEPKQSGKERRRAKQKKPGDHVFGKANAGKIRVDWKNIASETLGEVDFPGAVIWLNESNKTLCQLRDAENEQALLAICAGMYVNDAVAERKVQSYLPGFVKTLQEGERFSGLWAALLSSLGDDQGSALAIAGN